MMSYVLVIGFIALLAAIAIAGIWAVVQAIRHERTRERRTKGSTTMLAGLEIWRRKRSGG